jgi:hypothetical protein
MLARRVDVQQRAIAAPVFRRGVDVEDARHAAPLPLAIEQAGLLAGQRIQERLIGERETLAEAGRGLHRGLAEAVVELAAPRPGDVNQHAVVGLPPILIEVEAERQVVALHPAGLRHPEAESVLDQPGQRVLAARVVLQE